MKFFYLFKGDANSLFSSEFRRGGLAALFSCLILQILNTPTLTITLEGRNEDETSFTTMGTFSSITTVGVKMLDQGTLKEILRFKFDVAGASGNSGVCIELLGPQWRQYT